MKAPVMTSTGDDNLLSPVEQGALDSLFREGYTSVLLSQVSGPDDFQLVCFLVVR